ncbi:MULTISPECIES: hypothetical protein [unclassified Nocardia]|uniref:hypothetical protein n=1 Tax=unclassified Nocardia TaxID=2637762 RepID=UPI001CE42E8D|nr:MULTISPECIES: hypothetical protein [unclassified Nocardia]
MITLTIDDTRLSECLHNGTWLSRVPTTPAGWKARWHRTTRTIVDEIVTYGGILRAEGMPEERTVSLRYDLLTNPIGVQIWLQTDRDDALLGVRLAPVTYQKGTHFTGQTDTPAEAAVAFVAALVADLNRSFHAVQLVLGTPVAPATEPRIELVVHRDLDGSTDTDFYVNGQPSHQLVEYHVDPGHGWTPDDWRTAREDNLTAASPAARARLLEIYQHTRPQYTYSHHEDTDL